MARLLVAGLLLGTSCLFGTGSASAEALSPSQCTTTSGVILAVDFGHFGGGYYRSCGSTPTSGLTLLQQGGWSMAGTRQYGNAFVCKIGYTGFDGGTQYPTDFGCAVTPPQTAYWSYWHANQGDGSWSHSTAGASAYSPQPGSVDAWAFGAGDPPSFSPDSVRAHNSSNPGGGTAGGGGAIGLPAPPPASGPSSAPAGGSPRTNVGSPSAPDSSDARSDGGQSSSRPSGAVPARSTSAQLPKVKLPSRTSSSSASSVPSTASSSPSATSSASAAKPGSGSVGPTVVAVLVIVGIAALAGWQFWRRKQASRYS